MHFCFTGFGPVSVKKLDVQSQTEPEISLCEKLYPASDPYSLTRLSEINSWINNSFIYSIE